jgi:hypothetical protein
MKTAALTYVDKARNAGFPHGNNPQIHESYKNIPEGKRTFFACGQYHR